MGFVDSWDKNAALSGIRLKRAMLRYHRVIFLFYICLVLNNMMALVVFIFMEYEELQHKKDGTGIGYKHFFQNLVGNILIEHGLKLAAEYWCHRAANTLIGFARCVLAKKLVHKLRGDGSAATSDTATLSRQRSVEGRGQNIPVMQSRVTSTSQFAHINTT